MMVGTLYILNEIFVNGYSSFILDLFALSSVVCAIFVIISKNPIVSVLFLIGLFLSIASYLLIIGISFIGLSYLLVYVGAVSILFLFILMLINIRISELLSETKNSIPLVFIIAFTFSNIFYDILPQSISFFYSYNNNNFFKLFFYPINSEIEIYFTSSNYWDSNIAEVNHITSIGNIMYTSYSIWLIITSIILLLAMVGAIVITMKQKN